MRAGCMGWVMATISLILGGTATAQVPQAPPPLDYNYVRAYRHFAGSRYSYRVLSSSVPGSGSVTVAPFVYQSQFIDPAFSRQRIMPSGYERFQVVPGSGAMIMTPWSYSSNYVPGFSYGYYVPWTR
jgi:hypothetical protein